MKKLIFTLLLLIPFFVTYSQDTIRVPGDYTTIQAAINTANNGDIVLVSEDTYYENINFNGKAITVASYFCIDGDETHIGNTIIDGSQPSHPDSGSVVFFISGEDTNSVLCGFTITGGTGTATSTPDLNRLGGGIIVFESGATIKNNIIDSNVIQYDQYALGGGIGAFSEFEQNFIIENNILRNNSITSTGANLTAQGGGIYSRTIGSVRIATNMIIDNTITAPNFAYGGGIYPDGTDDTNYLVTNNFVVGNIVDAPSGGSGGIDIFNHSFPVRNNLIVNNSAPFGGGILIEFLTNEANLINRIGYDTEMLGDGDNHQSSSQGVPLLVNNTIANNTATVGGGGIYILGPVVPNLMNDIIWGNTAPSGPQIFGTANVQYSDVEGGYTGVGNIDSDPLFDTNEFYFLTSSSPCIDVGNPDPIYNDIEYPVGSGDPLYPAQGTLRNDMGHSGGPASNWGYAPWPIPVELTSFTAVTRFGKVILNWTTATEINNLGFEIERKIINNETNGEWILIGYREGYGTTTEPKDYSFVDDVSGITANSFSYRLKQIDFDGSYEYSDEVMVDNPAPSDYALHQNYPNPFNPVTTLKFGVPNKSNIVLKVFNTLGEEVVQLVNEEKPAGIYEVKFNATGLSSGLYFYQLKTEGYVETKKMVLMK